MIVLVQANVLTVGLNGRSQALRQLPVRVLAMDKGLEAVRSLKTERIDGVVSKWDLDDMRGGQFIKGLRLAKPEIPTIVLVGPDHIHQEISARSLGVAAVLPETASDELFQQTLADVLGLEGVCIKAVSVAVGQQDSEQP